MTNDEFKRYIAQRLRAVRESLEPENLAKLAKAEADGLRVQEAMLTRADRMARYSSGPEFRRFRRDYERRLAKTERPRTDTQ